ncbi:helix-turn-helix domain-containing protein [Lacrimispora sp. 38-1]|uniref:helix-turn-helix domain-containing protein n=1 Tax=Lacrimispora sp. 38-1 TaxID=3125778 RepID=UPI003CF845C3
MDTFAFLKSPNQVNKDLAARIKDRRKEQNLTQVQLSKRSEVSLGSIKRFENTGEISLTSLIKIAFALGLENDFELLFVKKGYSSIQEVINDRS